VSVVHFPRLAVFDCDGTLVDSQHSIVSAMHSAFAANGFEKPEPEAVRRVVGLSLVEAISRFLPDADTSTHDRITESYKEAFLSLRTRGEVREPLFPGTREGLETLDAAGWLLGVATGKGSRGLVITLEHHGLAGFFVTLQTADVARGKPNPDMLFRAMAETGADPGATVMIGDTTFDMQMARNAGTRAIGVAWGYHATRELWEAGAHIVVNDFGALPKAMENMLEDQP
jgi:phosphoglycolate phosphatase